MRCHQLPRLPCRLPAGCDVGHWMPGLQVGEGLGSDCLAGAVTESEGHLDVDKAARAGTQLTSVLTERPVRGEGWTLS